MPSRPPGPTAFPASWARRCAVLVLVLLVPLTATACRSASDPTASPERLTRNDAQVSDVEINPLMVRRDDVVGVDALVVQKRKTAQ